MRDNQSQFILHGRKFWWKIKHERMEKKEMMSNLYRKLITNDSKLTMETTNGNGMSSFDDSNIYY